MSQLDIVPIYLADRSRLLERLSRDLDGSLGIATRIRKPSFDPENSFDSPRGQYNSTILLRLLLQEGSQATRILGITSVDLFIPILTFVFGEAQLDGQAAVVSIHRLRPEAYGLRPDENLVAERLTKESIHELGHTFGLVHCPDPGCVMHASTYVEEIDVKTAAYCTSCLQRVRGEPSA